MMKTMNLPAVIEQRRHPSPAPAPQALAWDLGTTTLWLGSRDWRAIYAIDVARWNASEQFKPPGIPWAAVARGDIITFTIGEGEEDDRYLWNYEPAKGFTAESRVACPELTGSYLSYDGRQLYLSQWYKHRILRLSAGGEIERVIDVGAEICGHCFVDGTLYFLRGTEKNGENWSIARIDQVKQNAVVEDIAEVPFACRSLTWDGELFWTNHRAANQIVAFALPDC